MTAAAPLRERLAGGEALVGTFVQTPHPVACELLGRLGFDLLCVEAEHSVRGAEDVRDLVRAADCIARPALVRVARCDSVEIGSALDAGAAGVVVPRVESGEQAAAAVAAARFPPEGERGVGPGRAAGHGLDLEDYVGRANAEVLVAIQIETERAIDRLDEILSVPGVDLAFVGPGDLAVSLGISAGGGDPRLEATIGEILARATARGLPAGIFAATRADAARWLRAGAALIVLGSDLAFMADGASRALAGLREEDRHREP